MNYLIPSALLFAAFTGPFPAIAAAPPALDTVPAWLVDEPQGPVFLVTLDGMMCLDCQNKVQGALEKMDGVGKVAADWHKGTAHVTMKDAYGVITLEQVQKALADFKDFTVKEVTRM